MNGSQPRVVDLDALEALNPDPVVFRIGGKELFMEELPHAELMALLSEIDGAQAAATSGDVAQLRAAGDIAIDGIMRIFGPFNEWLTPEWVAGLTETKIVALLQRGVLAQQGFVGSLEVPDLPPSRAVRRAAVRQTGGKSTASSRSTSRPSRSKRSGASR